MTRNTFANSVARLRSSLAFDVCHRRESTFCRILSSRGYAEETGSHVADCVMDGVACQTSGPRPVPKRQVTLI